MNTKAKPTKLSPVPATLYVPTFGQPEWADTEYRRAVAFERWTSNFGPCVVFGCDGDACSYHGLCEEHEP